MASRGSWRTRFGFYLVAIGSAFGLGNLWRFPYVVGENGGGAFILLYVLLAFVMGAPLLICELMIGQKTRKSAIQAMSQLGGKKFKYSKYAGLAAIVMSATVLAYYSVISGWVLHFLSQSLYSIFFSVEVSGISLSYLSDHGTMQWLLASVHILVTIVFVAKGVHEGLEKWISYVMPFFALLVVVLVSKSLSLSSSDQVLRFLFYPDFSKLSPSSLIHAIGHVLFTLSVGFGTMITFGSYMKTEDHTPTAGFRLAMVDTFISLIAVLLIFPIAFQVSNTPLTDPALLFEVLPNFLNSIPGGQLFGFVFFSCLYFAALNASIGLFESVVSSLVDYKKLSRVKASWMAGALVLFISLFPATGGKLFLSMGWTHRSPIEFMDSVLVHWLLPIVALSILYFFLRAIDREELEELFIDEKRILSKTLFPYWYFSLKWIVPGVIVFGFLLNLWFL